MAHINLKCYLWGNYLFNNQYVKKYVRGVKLKDMGRDRLSKLIEIAVPLPIHQTFTYEVPLSLITDAQIGKRVLIPFGRRRLTGYIVGWPQASPSEALKPITDILDAQPLFPESMLPFFRWIADYYHSSLGEVIKCALPGGLNLREVTEARITKLGQAVLQTGIEDSESRCILEKLVQGPSPVTSLAKKIEGATARAKLKKMEKKAWIAIRSKLPSRQVHPKYKRFVRLQSPKYVADERYNRLSPIKRQILSALSGHTEGCFTQDLKATFPTLNSHLKRLQQDGFVDVYKKRVYRDPFGEAVVPDRKLALTSDQASVQDALVKELGRGFECYLLAGVTGSGKTEIYLQLAQEAVSKGLYVLVLVPEIALISQMEGRFRARFGERIALLHSGLSAGERYDQWLRILQQETPIAIGARSAVFAPFPQVGLIIVDEEHDPSYKQENSPRYHARDVAVMRAKMDGALVLLGSATPSLETYFNALVVQKYKTLHLPKRIQPSSLPQVTIVDLNQTKKEKGFRRFLTPALRAAIQRTLEAGGQTLLFVNRRGFANYPICESCGEVMQCRHCAISLTYHQQANALRCHYCGFNMPATMPCQSCGSGRIKRLGFGTEKVAAALEMFFPHARVARLDRDTTTRKGALLKILKEVKNRQIDMLVGTQMVAKGHDFPNITLVGIICADLSLHFPDFRSCERTFQLLAQVAGRAGRGSIPGKVILQTYMPDHYSVTTARDQDYQAFLEKEIQGRSALAYPPFSRMIQLKISSRSRPKGDAVAHQLGDACRAACSGRQSSWGDLTILGPVVAPLSKIGHWYRWQMILKAERSSVLHRFVRQMVKDHPCYFRHRQVKVDIDVDPYSMM